MRRLLVFVLIIMGCETMVIDPSMNAVEAGDYTLALSACEGVPGRGMDICRVKEGQKIFSVWRMVVPVDMNHNFLGGEVVVYFRDISKTYAIQNAVIEIPWRDFFSQDTWAENMDGEFLALAALRYKDASGVEKILKGRGIAKIVVTKPGYDPLPLDSGFGAWNTTCKIQYSTAGRSAIKCTP